MEHSDHRLHAGLQNSVDDVVVVVYGLLINRGPGQGKWQNACPRDGETVVLHSHSGQSLDILLVQEIVLVGYIVLGLLRVGDLFL